MYKGANASGAASSTTSGSHEVKPRSQSVFSLRHVNTDSSLMWEWCEAKCFDVVISPTQTMPSHHASNSSGENTAHCCC